MITDTKARTYDFFFNKVGYSLIKGRGFSLFNADNASIASFSEQCDQKGLDPLTIKLSSIENGLSNIPASPKFVTIIHWVGVPMRIAKLSEKTFIKILPRLSMHCWPNKFSLS